MMKNILTYQGNKTKLIDYISKNINEYLVEGKALLDIFTGGGSIAKYYKDKIKVYANDLEVYSYHIVNSFLSKSKKIDCEIIDKFLNDYKNNFSFLYARLSNYIQDENNYINDCNITMTKELYYNYPTIWNQKYSEIINDYLDWKKLNNKDHYYLFSTHYAGTYFGILQSIEIDSIRYAISNISLDYNVSCFFSCLYYAMNQVVFSKDGHMAQPLDIEKNQSKLFKKRSISVLDVFMETLENFNQNCCVFEHKVFNYELNSIICNSEIIKRVGCIYADPPYTDMQYSRYYHLLNTVTIYEYCSPTFKNDKYTKGLYLSNRNQSKLSSKNSCMYEMIKLMEVCSNNRINLVISYGYPEFNSSEKKDRYVMTFEDLINSCFKVFGKENVKIERMCYEHTNHRNSKKKHVIEYLICCRGNVAAYDK